MKKFSGHTFIFIMLSVLVMSSCIYDYYADGDGPGSGTEDKIHLVLHIRSLDTRTTSSGAPTERIKSLRIIILNEEIEASDDGNAGQPGEDSENVNADDGNTNRTSKLSIEYNELIEFGTGYASNGFDYMFIKQTIPGKKHFYFIANEESVKKIHFEGEIGSDYEGKDLSEFLGAEKYKVPKDGQDDTENRELPDATELEDLLKSVYFAPEYNIENINESNNIYLPYTTYYGGDEFKLLGKLDEGQVIEKQMFLVPVATKFEFNFINNRTNPVEINNITVSTSTTEEKTVSDDNDTQTTVVSAGLAKHNFLLAHVCDSDVQKKIDTTSYYWVDWLDKVSKASWSNQPFDDNISFNDKYGWIKNYEIPAVALTDRRDKVTFVSSPDDATKKIVSAVNKVDEQNPIPGELSLGPYYLPESRQEETYKVTDEGKEVTKKEQRYYLTLGLHDESQESSKDPKFEEVQISNLKALFRNTYVIINIKMSEGTVEAYAEIAPWNKKSINGWVTEGQAPSGNLFLTDSDANK